MKTVSWRRQKWVVAELRANSFHAWAEGAGWEMPLTRGPDGRLNADCTEAIVDGLRRLLGSSSWISQSRIICAIPARGLILRAVSLPPTPAADIPRILQLHLEAEFPLPPESLTWGWLPSLTTQSMGVEEPPPIMVGAVRKDATDELAAVLSRVTSQIVFTPGLLARAALVPADTMPFAVLDVGPTHSELLCWHPAKPPSIRVLAWGESSENDNNPSLTSSRPSPQSTTAPAPLNQIPDVPLFISGPAKTVHWAINRLSPFRSTYGRPVPLTDPEEPGLTAAMEGIRRIQNSSPSSGTSGAERSTLLLEMHREPVRTVPVRSGRIPQRPAAMAAALLLAVLLAPYLEALLLQPALARRLTALKSESEQLAVIDRELSFLQFLEQNQSPHVDAVYVVANAIPQGSRIETMNLSRQGEVSLTGWLRDPSQLGEFRLKLINSGFFSTVVVEDQSPTPDRQRINFRITARWKDATERAALKLSPVTPDSVQAKSTNSPPLSPQPKAEVPPPPR